MKLATTIAFAVLANSISASAAIVQFDLLGKAGSGLLSGNENGSIISTPNLPGTGGEIGTGIFLDDVTLQLTINVGWGSSNGFLNLSSNVNNSHIHGPTSSGGTGSFTQNATVLFDLPRNSNDPSSGTITHTLMINSVQATDLLAGKWYVNIHTTQNGGGEIRGNIVQVPEPASMALLGTAAIGLLARRRSRSAV
jgi:hypothetical protein